jgi:glycosyltransferase involved in cell wall biosynthesis
MKQALVVDVLQMGAREHYMLPMALHQLGHLRKFHTDLYCGKGSILSFVNPFLRSIPVAALQSLSSRSSGLPGSSVESNNFLGLVNLLLVNRASTTLQRTLLYHVFFNLFAERYYQATNSTPDLLIGFKGVGAIAERYGSEIPYLLDQIDGGYHEIIAVMNEQYQHRGWLSTTPDWINTYPSPPRWLEIENERHIFECKHAIHIVCNSQWTATCLANIGIKSDKCSIIPLSYSPTGCDRSIRYYGSRLNVAFLGSVTLRKGIHHLLMAARIASESVDIHVHIAGGRQEVSLEALALYSNISTYYGRIPRSDVPRFLKYCDILALPSVSEGFGIVQIEAMAYGLPVIASDRTGAVVRDGVDGFVVLSGDIEALASRLILCATNHSLLADLSACALQRSTEFGYEQYCAAWSDLLARLPVEANELT